MQNRKLPELLAPAGSMEAVRAAVQNGAGAVYLGVGTFNARRGAKNFSPEQMREAIAYCRLRGVKTYISVNTLGSDGEIPSLLRDVRLLLDEFANIGLIPKFDKLIATIRSREISACIVLQAQSQLKAIYKDNADTIVGNCVRPEAASAQ